MMNLLCIYNTVIIKINTTVFAEETHPKGTVGNLDYVVY